jgi:hypothetical protein
MEISSGLLKVSIAPAYAERGPQGQELMAPICQHLEKSAPAVQYIGCCLDASTGAQGDVYEHSSHFAGDPSP